ncbi:MAG: hypothetical protein ACKPKO_13170, partial [Candidatus Fonsibacter sp.]
IPLNLKSRNSMTWNVGLVQNNDMGFYEECLSLGQWLDEDIKRALYKFLLKKNEETYKMEIRELLKNKEFSKFIANGEIHYSIEDKIVKFTSREVGTQKFINEIRELKLGRMTWRNLRKLTKFFAQCEVDVIRNFPYPGANKQDSDGFVINTYPYYDLSYYSNGGNRFSGYINMIKTNDTELLRKLAN